VSVMVSAAVTAAVTSTTPTTSVTHLSHSDGVLAVVLVVGFVLLAGAVVAVGRRVLEGAPTSRSGSGPGAAGTGSQKDRADSTLVRSWLAMSLVGGLLIFAAVSFWLDDTTLRSTLIGGVIANAGAAVAFYFASKSSDQARRDILNAALPSAVVPDLIGNNLATAQQAVAATPFRLEVSPANPSPDAQVVSQHPAANQPAMAGSPVAATLAGPVPNVTGATLDQAQSMLAAVGLQLEAVPSQPAQGSTVTSQDPPVGQAVPTSLTVRGTFS
jgi:PASTA domain-containing protein